MKNLHFRNTFSHDIRPKPVFSKPIMKRGTRIGKSISPGGQKGILEVTLLYKNKARIARENILINEFIPRDFSLIKSNKQISEKKYTQGTIVSWMLDYVDPGEEIEIHYTLESKKPTASLKNPICNAFK